VCVANKYICLLPFIIGILVSSPLNVQQHQFSFAPTPSQALSFAPTQPPYIKNRPTSPTRTFGHWPDRRSSAIVLATMSGRGTAGRGLIGSAIPAALTLFVLYFGFLASSVVYFSVHVTPGL